MAIRLLEAERERRRRVRRFDWRGAECPFHSPSEPYIPGKCIHARPKQLLPDGDWRIWLLRAGRGFGKTRTGAETVREWSERYSRIGLIAPTGDDARDIMVEGESGLLAVFPPDRPARYVANRRRIEFPSGSIGTLYTADEPDRLRGPQHTKLWMDELAAWRYLEDAYDMAMLGLRLGDNPQAIITTTPKNLPLIRELRDRARLESDPLGKVIETTGSTYENRENLAPAFVAEVIQKYEGTRLGRQELEAEILEDVEDALWQRGWIETARRPAPRIIRGGESVLDLVRIVVSIDPAVTSGASSDETGIVGSGIGPDGDGYVLADWSVKGSPREWAARAVGLYRELGADRIVAEANNGGDLVSTVIAQVDPNVPVTLVHASRGKITRAEPIAALYEQGRVHHVEPLPRLEDQLCSYTGKPGEASPDRMDALTWGLSELFGVKVSESWGGGSWGGSGSVVADSGGRSRGWRQ